MTKRIASLSIGDAELEVQGRWVEVDSTLNSSILFGESNISKNETVEISFSSVLPNDGHAYECQLFLSGLGAQNSVGILTSTDGSNINRVWICSSGMWSCNHFNCLIGASRKINITCGNSEFNSASLRIYRYRKV